MTVTVTATHRYTSDERLPVEVLVFRVEPSQLDEFLRIDHEVWTMGEAFLPGSERIPFLSKEVWLDDSKPGEVTLSFVWESMAAWRAVGAADIQARIQAEFDRRFTGQVELVRAMHEESSYGVHRWSRFERLGD